MRFIGILRMFRVYELIPQIGKAPAEILFLLGDDAAVAIVFARNNCEKRRINVRDIRTGGWLKA